MSDWDQLMLPGLEPTYGWLSDHLMECQACGATVVDTVPVVNPHPTPKGNLRLTVAAGEIHAEAVPISQHQLGEHLHLAHVVTCRPRKGSTPQ